MFNNIKYVNEYYYLFIYEIFDLKNLYKINIKYIYFIILLFKNEKFNLKSNS